MARGSQILWLAAMVFLAAGGCPPTGLTGADGTSALAAASSSTGSSGPAADGTAASADPLASKYPECSLPLTEEQWRTEIVRLVNTERTARGLGTLTINQTLQDQADEYACEMVHYNFFDHVNPVTGSTLGQRADEFKYDYTVVGENLAAGQRSPAQAFRDWMNSPGHRQNILEPRFTEIGVAVRTGGTYGTYWVQEFGRPAVHASR